MSDAIVRLLARPRLHLGEHVFSPHAYSLRMFLGEVPTLTVELTDGVSSGPASIFNEGLQEVVAGLERVVGSTAPRVPATLDMVATNGLTSTLFRGYAVSCDATLSVANGHRAFRVTCLGLACPLTRRPGPGEVPFDCSTLVRMVRDAKLSSPQQIASSVSATEAVYSGLRLTAASPESMLLQSLPDRIMGLPVDRQLSVIVENLDRQSVFTAGAKELTDESNRDFDAAISGSVDLPDGALNHVRRAFSASLVAGLVKSFGTPGMSVYEAIAQLLASDSYMLTLAPRISLNERHDCMMELVPIQPPDDEPFDLDRVSAAQRSVRMGLWTQTPDVLFSLFASPLEIASASGRESLAAFYGVSALDPELREYLQSRSSETFSRDMGTLNVSRRTLPAWAAAAVAAPEALVGRRGGDDARQPHDGSEMPSPLSPVPTDAVRDLCNRIADTQLTGLALSESKAFVSLPDGGDPLGADNGILGHDGGVRNLIGKTMHLRLDPIQAPEPEHVFGELQGITDNYTAVADGASAFRTDLTLWRVRTSSTNVDPLGDAPVPIYGSKP